MTGAQTRAIAEDIAADPGIASIGAIEADELW